MTRFLRLAAFSSLFLATLAAAQGKPQAGPRDIHSADFRSIERKLDYLRQNGERAKPDPRPTELTAVEVNAYFKEGGVRLPKGIAGLHLSSQPSVIDAVARIDFNVLTEKARSSNPLLSLFTGVHQVRIVAQASGSHGTASIHAQSVYLDGTQIPQMLVDLFVSHYVTSKYAHVGTTTTFSMPLRIDSAVVDTNRVRLTQR